MSIFNLTTEFPSGPRFLWGTRRITFPIQRDPVHFQVSDDYLYSRTLYAKLSLGTPHPEYPTAILVDENPTKIEGDAIWFTRTYSTVPSDRSEPSTASMQFPGFVNTGDPFLADRVPFSNGSLARVEYKYYLTSDPFGLVDPLNIIPIVTGFVVTDANTPTVVTQYVYNSGGTFNGPSSPNRTAYEFKINNGQEIPVKDSEITQYAGNIWQRRTVYVKAQ